MVDNIDNVDRGTSLTEHTVDLLSAFVANNNVRAEDLAGLIASTHAALAQLSDTSAASSGNQAAQGEEPEHAPAVTARKSLASRDHIVSMIDGKPYKTLKRHLTRHGLTPDEYRQRYKLPASYPMVAPSYSEKRRETAQQIGLGRKRSGATPEQAQAKPEQGEAKPAANGKAAAKPRGRRLSGKDALTKARAGSSAEG